MGFFSKIFESKDKEFNEVKIDQNVIDSVIYYSKEAYPHEFLALFEGKVERKILYITGLIFIPGDTGDTGAVFRSDMLPPNSDYWGSVHSHPGPSAQPSGADLSTFSKHGVFHMIVCLPYSRETFKAYDKYGEPVDYTIGDYFDKVDNDYSDFFDEDDVLKDGEKVDLGFFDEDDFDEEENSNKPTYEDFEKQNLNNQIVIDEDIFKNGGSINIQLDENGQIKNITTSSPAINSTDFIDEKKKKNKKQ